ncbi:MAG: hypothetical protein BRD50_05245, partial [Bacteroidetes bacterium SW_11_45_7]
MGKASRKKQTKKQEPQQTSKAQPSGSSSGQSSLSQWLPLSDNRRMLWLQAAIVFGFAFLLYANTLG